MKPEEFIKKNIVVEEILDLKIASISVNFRGIEMPVVGCISDVSPVHIYYDSKRPRELHPKGGMLGCVADINEFFGDMTTILYFLNNREILNDYSIFRAAEFICGEHIKRLGRIIDSDMFSYIDLTIIAKHQVWSKLKKHNLSDIEAETLWVDLKNHILEVYEDSIYITKYDLSNPLEPKPYLIKLT